MSLALSDLLIVIQARMNSHRLPGKVLNEIAGKPALQHLTESVLQICRPDQVIIATSVQDLDNPVAEFCKRHSLNCFRGPLENVADRFLQVIRCYKPDVFIRISADSPLFDYRTLERAFPLWKEGVDLLTTVGGGYPSGMNAEFVRSSTFCSTYQQFYAWNHFEHVTPYFYENEARFTIKRLEAVLSLKDSFKFSLDTPEDLEVIEKLFNLMERAHYTYTLEEKVLLLKSIVRDT